jgi:endonuclease/exonuclease/phosphatase family metal-dependent hydrolase
LTTPGGTINSERGFLVVDAAVAGQAIRFVNTHLEVPELARAIQALQAAELIGRLNAMAQPGLPTVIAGDINSAPTEGDVITPGGVIPSAYRQFLLAGYADTWNLRPGKSPGLTCCQANDLSNAQSELFKRVDVIFARTPSETHANLLGVDQEDRTPSGLWPSDHAGIVALLRFGQ